MKHLILTALMTAFFLPVATTALAGQRPVYVVVHRANDLDDIEEAIEGGANGIEIDLQLCGDGMIWKVHHDNCRGSVGLLSWLMTFQLNADKSNIAFLNFDIKADLKDNSAAMVRTLRDFARAFFQEDLLVVYSVGDWDNRANLMGIQYDLKPNEFVAIDFSKGASWKQKVDYFSTLQIENFAFADGIYAGLNTPRSVFTNVDGARDDGRAKLVYSWTFESENPIEDMLIDRKLDGVLVNDCKVFCVNHLVIDDGLDNAKDVLEDHSEIRLATRKDTLRWGK